MLGAGAPRRLRRMVRGGRREGGSGWGTRVHLWRIHIDVWQKPLQYCKAITLQLNILNFFFKKGRGCEKNDKNVLHVYLHKST